MNVLERADEGIAYEQIRLENELEQQKRDWEVDRQRAIANNEEMMKKKRMSRRVLLRKFHAPMKSH